MNNWIITVILISVFGYFTKVLLPEGKNKNLVIFAISMVSIIAIISPLLKLTTNDFELNFDFGLEVYIDEAFLEYSENCREKYYLTIANTSLKEYLTINNADFVFDDKASGNPLKKIIINFNDIVINQNNEHINISLIIKERLSEQFALDKESIIIND